jgi:hypothetical protein
LALSPESPGFSPGLFIFGPGSPVAEAIAAGVAIP